jgi:hypothetical protein
MKHLFCIISIVLLGVFVAQAQQNPSRNVNKKKQPTNQPSGNPGDPNNAKPGPTQKGPGESDSEESDDGSEGELLGEENRKSQPNDGTSDNDRSNYRNNRVSGNPNNRNSVNEGSNRRSISESDESSTGTTNDTTGMATDNSGSGNNTSSGVITDETTSSSGSPAVPSKENERDGTNNVQRAKPNMAGAKVGGLRTGKKNVDPDKEIRSGSQRQQTESVGNDVSRSRRFNQQGQRMRQQHSKSQNHQQGRAGAKYKGNSINDDSKESKEKVNEDDESEVGTLVDQKKDKESKKEKKRKKRNKD